MKDPTGRTVRFNVDEGCDIGDVSDNPWLEFHDPDQVDEEKTVITEILAEEVLEWLVGSKSVHCNDKHDEAVSWALASRIVEKLYGAGEYFLTAMEGEDDKEDIPF